MKEFGWLDLPGLLFHAIDYGWRTFLPAGVTLPIWSLVCAYAFMRVYRRFSDQPALAALSPHFKWANQCLITFRGPREALRPLLVDAARMWWRRLRLFVLPGSLGAIPLLLVLLWLSNDYAYRQPNPGSRVEVSVSGFTGDRADLSWIGAKAQAAPDQPRAWILTWPRRGGRVALLTVSGKKIVTLPSSTPVDVLRKRRWWNTWIANPGGYLEPGAVVDSLRVDVPQKTYLPFGPDWMRGWVFTWIAMFLAGCFGLKRRWRLY